MSNQLESLREATVVVADTGDFGAIAKFRPHDATTNPSLINAAARLPQYRPLVDDAIAFGKANAATFGCTVLELVLDKLAVNFGVEILKIVPGYVSTEVGQPPCLSLLPRPSYTI
jgi:transaldolase